MIKYEDKHSTSKDFGSFAPLNFEPSLSDNHAQSAEIALRLKCAVCALEENWMREKNISECKGWGQDNRGIW